MMNFTEFMEDFIGISMQPYTDVLGVFVWPLVFTAIIGYVYLKNQSVVAAASAGLIIFAVFSNHLVGVGAWNNLMIVLILLALTGLFLYFIVKKRGV